LGRKRKEDISGLSETFGLFGFGYSEESSGNNLRLDVNIIEGPRPLFRGGLDSEENFLGGHLSKALQPLEDRRTGSSERKNRLHVRIPHASGQRVSMSLVR